MTTTAEPGAYAATYTGPYTDDVAKRRLMGAQDVRARFSERIDAADSGEHTIVLRRSAPDAVLVSARWYSEACAALGDPWDEWEPPPARQEIPMQDPPEG